MNSMEPPRCLLPGPSPKDQGLVTCPIPCWTTHHDPSSTPIVSAPLSFSDRKALTPAMKSSLIPRTTTERPSGQLRPRVFVHSVRIRRGLIQAWKVRVSFNLSSSRRSLMLLQLRRMLSSSGLGVSGQMKVICPGSDLNFTLASSLTSE